jgi:hypothetical protein
MKTGAPRKTICPRGHNMDISRRTYANGDTYCYECKKIRYTKFRIDYPERVAEYARRSRLRSWYGLSETSFNELLEKQQGVCAICKTADWGWRGVPHVDHDHTTKKVRGLLCHYCNTALGGFRDSEVILKSALLYMSKAGKAKKGKK